MKVDIQLVVPYNDRSEGLYFKETNPNYYLVTVRFKLVILL
jgi:hypothetical protein